MGMELAGFGTIMGATSLMRSIEAGLSSGRCWPMRPLTQTDKRNADMMDDLADVQKKKDLKM